METVTLKIKNMVCPRCIKVVREDMERLGLEVISVGLGEATVKSKEGPIDMPAIREVLQSEGFDILEDTQAVLVEQTKIAIINLIYSGQIEEMEINFSEYLSGKIGLEYHHISMAFSSAEHITLEKFFILQKIERAKELLSYDELSFSTIARNLRYSSIAHFSNQFKQITGFTPTQYKKEGLAARKPLDGVK
jgi:AraC family transcriptional regulator